MFKGWSIRRRLLLIATGLSAVILVLMAILNLNTASDIINSQTNDALISRNQALAQTLNGEFSRWNGALTTLAASLESRPANSLSVLWSPATRLMRDESLPFERVGVMLPLRDGYSILSLQRPGSLQNKSPLSRFYMNEQPAEAWITSALNADGITWFGPHDSYRLNLTNPVITMAHPLNDNAGNAVGLVWFDIPLPYFQRLLNQQARPDARVRPGYVLLMNMDAQTLAAYQGPDNTVDRMAEETVVAQQLIAQAPAIPVLEDDPLNNDIDAYRVRSEVEANGWSLVDILSANTFTAPLQSMSFQMIFVILAGVALLGWLIYSFVNYSLSEPLVSITSAAQEIGSGDMRYQIGFKDRQDEIGYLATALDDMKQNLAHSYEELSLWSRRLERRVTERTQELEQARQEAQLTATELQAVYDASLALVGAYQLDTILQKLIDSVQQLLTASYVAIWLLDQSGDYMDLAATTWANRTLDNRRITNDQGVAGRTVQSMQPVLIDDYTNWPGKLGFTHPDVHRVLSLPLSFYGKPLGAIFVGRSIEEPSFNDDDRQTLTLFANLASPLVRNAQLYNQVETAQHQAESANQVKTRFLASVTHELRTPLNLIINNMDFMRIGIFGDVNDEQRERLDQTIRSAEHLLYLINDLLDVSKIEAGEMQLSFQQTELYPMLEDTLDSVLAYIGEKRKVALMPDIPEGLPQMTIDSRRIRQVLLNLLTNAVKFTPEGEVHFSVRPAEAGNGVWFNVKDSGIGIPKEEIALIFEAFERSKPSKQMGIEGTGLGLPISKFLVEAHGGRIEVDSEVGKGSSFNVFLPLQPPEDASSSPKAAALLGQGD